MPRLLVGVLCASFVFTAAIHEGVAAERPAAIDTADETTDAKKDRIMGAIMGVLIGDALGDFVSGDDVAASKRKEMVRQHAEYWGSRWIVLPNPQYGAWDGALIGFDFALSRDQKRIMKRAALDPSR